jgi:hypothetical protein
MRAVTPAGDGAARSLTQALWMRQRTLTASALAFGLGLAIALAWSLVSGGGF